MNLKGLASQVAMSMRREGVRKHVNLPKTVFHVSDDDGNTRDFAIKKTDKDVMYTVEDVENILNASIRAIFDLIQNGEKLSIKDFGVLETKYRSPRMAKHPCTGEMVVVDGRYVVKFTPGNRLKISARIYEKSLEDSAQEQAPLFDESLYLPDDEEEVVDNGS